MSSSKLICKETLRQVFICLEAQNPMNPPPPPYTRGGGGDGGKGGDLNQREGEKGNSSQSENTNWTD
jgi:hypothetical protein